jgi:putative ABC transport system permease protein
MPLLPSLSSLWRNLFRKAQKDQELTEEIEVYLEMLVEQKIKQGLDPKEARRAALIELGGKEQVKEKVREASAGHQLEILLQDLRYALRMLGRNPGFAAVAVLTLGLGIGANTAIFSLIDAILLKRLPVKNPERLILLRHANSRGTENTFAYRTFEQIRDQSQVLSGLLAYHPLRLTVSVDGQPEPAVAGQLVSGNYYSVLGVNAALGRMILPDDDRAPSESPVCVISYNYWQRRFAGDSAVVGKTIHLSGTPFTIIGVSQREFFGLEVGSSLDISVPQIMRRQVTAEGGYFKVMGRLRSEVTMPQAYASLSLLYQQLCAEYAATNWGVKGGFPNWLEEKLVLESGSRGLSELRWQFSRPLRLLMIVVALVLLITCANVAGLLLARAVARRKEIAIRLSLGGARLRLVRQLLTEGVLLAGLGALLGLLFASWGTRLLLPLLSQGEIPSHLNLSPDARALAFTAAVAMLTSMLFGLAPALLATRVDVNSTLKNDASGFATESRGASMTFGKLFVISQVALSLLLLIGAGLFVRSLRNLQRADAGFARENVLVTKLEPAGSRSKSPQLAARYDDLLRRAQAIPGVKLASLVGYSPMSRREWLVLGQNPEWSRAPMSVQGYTSRPDEEMWINWMQVYPNSFATLGIPLVAGRDFGPQDSQVWRPGPCSSAAQVGIINESMARRFFGNENPIGRRFGFAAVGPMPCPDGVMRGGAGAIEIIGVVKDVKYTSLRNEGREMFYLPFHQANTGFGEMTLVVRTAGDPTSITAAVRRETRTMDPAMPMFEVETLATQVSASLREERLLAMLSSGFGLLALLLSCLGLYGILSYAVAQRTKEIGVRMALGADRRDVLLLVLRDALRLVLFGAALGIPAALAAARLVASQLFGISAADPVAIGLATLALLGVAAVAGYLPARRATRVDPLMALRYD